MNGELFKIYGFFSFALGACIASFLNVVIWRVPRGESIVRPPSHCPKCNAPIKWYQNLPIVSWLALRGKCANCRAPISPRYILVETLGGMLFLAMFWHLSCLLSEGIPLTVWCVQLLIGWIWLSLMLVGSMIDFDHQLLPDFVTVGGMGLGLAWGVFQVAWIWRVPVPIPLLRLLAPLIYSLGGLVFGFGLLWLIRFLGSKAFKREAMGMGDVFLMGAVGALFGPVAVLFTLIASSVFGSLIGVGLICLSKAKPGKFIAIPFGPYICLGCLLWMFFGPELVNWYLMLLGC